MSTTLQLRRGTPASIATSSGSPGELFVDTTNWLLYLMDGITNGGHLIGPAGNGSISNVISTPTTIAADMSYLVVGYLTINSTFTVNGNVGVF